MKFKCILVKYFMKYNLYNFVVQSTSVASLHFGRRNSKEIEIL